MATPPSILLATLPSLCRAPQHLPSGTLIRGPSARAVVVRSSSSSGSALSRTAERLARPIAARGARTAAGSGFLRLRLLKWSLRLEPRPAVPPGVLPLASASGPGVGGREDGHVGLRTVGSLYPVLRGGSPALPPQGGGRGAGSRRVGRPPSWSSPRSFPFLLPGRWSTRGARSGRPTWGTRGGTEPGDLKPGDREALKTARTRPPSGSREPCPTCPLPIPTPALGAVQSLRLVAFQSYFRERSVHGLESRYSTGLSMLRILSTRSPRDGAELVQVG